MPLESHEHDLISIKTNILNFEKQIKKLSIDDICWLRRTDGHDWISQDLPRLRACSLDIIAQKLVLRNMFFVFAMFMLTVQENRFSRVQITERLRPKISPKPTAV